MTRADFIDMLLEYDWHDFWAQVAIAGLMAIIQMNEVSLGFGGVDYSGVDDYRL